MVGASACTLDLCMLHCFLAGGLARALADLRAAAVM